MIADANRMRGDVRVEHGREHPALRRRPRVRERQRNLDEMTLHRLEFAAGHAEALDLHFELITFGGIALDLNQLQPRVAADVIAEPVVVGLQSSETHGTHSLFSSSLSVASSAGGVSVGGNSILNIGTELRKVASQGYGILALQAATSGAGINELVGHVVAFSLLATTATPWPLPPGCRVLLVSLDEYRHWFTGKRADLLAIALDPTKVASTSPPSK